MPKINNKDIYPLDSNISKKDIILGSDGDTPQMQTKNFEVGQLIDFINSVNNLASFTFTFSDGLNPNIQPGIPGYFFSDNTIISSSSQLSFSKYTDSGKDILELFQYAIDSKLLIKITNSSKQNTIAYLTGDAFTVLGEYFVIDTAVSNSLALGIFANNDTYSFYFELNNSDSPVMYQDGTGVSSNTQLSNWSNTFAGRQQFYFDNNLRKLYIFDYSTSDFVVAKTKNYRSFEALLTQTGISNPSVNILNNDFSSTFTITRGFGSGGYNVLCSSPEFIDGKTVFLIEQPSIDFTKRAVAERISNNTGAIGTGDVSGVGLDGVLNNTFFEIRVYD